jgi:hypothetical protein
VQKNDSKEFRKYKFCSFRQLNFVSKYRNYIHSPSLRQSQWLEKFKPSGNISIEVPYKRKIKNSISAKCSLIAPISNFMDAIKIKIAE